METIRTACPDYIWFSVLRYTQSLHCSGRSKIFRRCSVMPVSRATCLFSLFDTYEVHVSLQWRWDLSFNYRPVRRVFKFMVYLNAVTSVQCTKAGIAGLMLFKSARGLWWFRHYKWPCFKSDLPIFDVCVAFVNRMDTVRVSSVLRFDWLAFQTQTHKFRSF